MKRLSALLCLILLAGSLQAQPIVNLDEDSPLRFGTPDTGRLMQHRGVVFSYDGRLRSARWVAERITKTSLEQNVVRRDEFRLDPFVPPEFRAADEDYAGSGFDRGHLAPSDDHTRSRLENSATFYFSNMSPQVGVHFNQHYWANLEKSIRELCDVDKVREVYVFTGPLFVPAEAPVQGEAHNDTLTVTYRLIGPNHIPVPTHYFKAILAVMRPIGGKNPRPRLEMWAFVLPNKAIAGDTPLETFAVTTDFLEHWAGFDLWSALADDIESDLEATANGDLLRPAPEM